MAAAMYLIGHIVEDIETYGIDERLLLLPMNELFQIISGDLSDLKGCYHYFDRCRKKWM